LTQDGGQAKVKIANGALTLPGVFEDPVVPFDQLSADAQWKLAGRKIEAQLRNLQFANADAQGDAQVSWRTADAGSGPPPAAGAPDPRFPGVLDLQGALSRGAGERVHRYLPLVLPDPVRHYVRDAVVQGQVSDVKFKVKGPAEELPFTNPAHGEFRVSAKVRNGHLAYVPKSIQPAGAAAWPALTELNGELVFNRAALEINGATGKVAGLPGLQLVKADARIADLTHDSTVDVNLEAQRRAVRRAGIRQPVPGGRHDQPCAGQEPLRPARANTGSAWGCPSIPLTNPASKEPSRCPGNDVQFAADVPPLTKLKGVVTVSERGFSVAAARRGCSAATSVLTAACARSRVRRAAPKRKPLRHSRAREPSPRKACGRPKNWGRSHAWPRAPPAARPIRRRWAFAAACLKSPSPATCRAWP
jgi:uncharacterized protein YhdP